MVSIRDFLKKKKSYPKHLISSVYCITSAPLWRCASKHTLWTEKHMFWPVGTMPLTHCGHREATTPHHDQTLLSTHRSSLLAKSLWEHNAPFHLSQYSHWTLFLFFNISCSCLFKSTSLSEAWHHSLCVSLCPSHISLKLFCFISLLFSFVFGFKSSNNER